MVIDGAAAEGRADVVDPAEWAEATSWPATITLLEETQEGEWYSIPRWVESVFTEI